MQNKKREMKTEKENDLNRVEVSPRPLAGTRDLSMK